jgi:hypothetical protein
MKTLMNVTSPHKAKGVIALALHMLKSIFFAWACPDHLRDLPEDILGVDREIEFAPEYTLPKIRKEIVRVMRLQDEPRRAGAVIQDAKDTASPPPTKTTQAKVSLTTDHRGYRRAKTLPPISHPIQVILRNFAVG